jgi:hypothetical protein
MRGRLMHARSKIGGQREKYKSIFGQIEAEGEEEKMFGFSACP